MQVIDFPTDYVLEKRQQEYAAAADLAFQRNDLENYVVYAARVEELELQIGRIRGLKKLSQYGRTT